MDSHIIGEGLQTNPSTGRFSASEHPPLSRCSETGRHGARPCFSLHTYLLKVEDTGPAPYVGMKLYRLEAACLIICPPACILYSGYAPIRLHTGPHIVDTYASNAVRTVFIHPTIHPSYHGFDSSLFFWSGSWPVKWSRSQGGKNTLPKVALDTAPRRARVLGSQR